MSEPQFEVLAGDSLEQLRLLPDESVHCCVTSPPYWGLRDYGVAGQLGMEATPDEYAAKLVEIFREVRRVLRKDGTCWLNLGDSYGATGNRNGISSSLTGSKEYYRGAGGEKPLPGLVIGLKPKDLIGIPWLVAFALRADGWTLRSDIIWSKINPMPESVTDRPTKAHEYIFLLTKSTKYFYDAGQIAQPAITQPSRGLKYGVAKAAKNGNADRDGQFNSSGMMRNARSVWHFASQPFVDAHFATFPEDLALMCIIAGCPRGGTVLDPFSGSATTGVVALRYERKYIGIELNPEYVKMSRNRLAGKKRMRWDQKRGRYFAARIGRYT